MEQDREHFAIDIRIRNKSAFMMLSFQDRIIKLRNYFKKEEYSFLGMSKEKNVTSEDSQNSSALTKKTILQYFRKRGLHEVRK